MGHSIINPLLARLHNGTPFTVRKTFVKTTGSSAKTNSWLGLASKTPSDKSDRRGEETVDLKTFSNGRLLKVIFSFAR